MSLLSDSESSSDERDVGVKLKINEKFADRFVREERAKELHRAKELLKNADLDEDEESDSESESEDEDAEQLSTGLDLKIIQTINMLRKKDPKIYDPNAKWFDEPQEDESSSDEDDDGKRKQSKKKKFKDVLREQLLESDAAGGLGDGDGIEASSRGVKDTVSKRALVYDAEQEKIRQAFLKTAAGKGESDSDEDDGVLQVKNKTAQELKEEEQELQKALKEMRELAARNERKEEAKQQQMKTKVLELENTDGFLEDYLKKQMWKDKRSQPKALKGSSLDDEDVEEDEEEIEEMERFESKYNFRFEELQDQKNGGGGAVEVMGHSRDVQGSMRRVDDKRKQQRESRKERKERERRQQEAELRRLKNLKRQELRERLKQIGKMSGLGDIELSDDEDEAADTDLNDGAAEEQGGKKAKKSRKGGKRARENKLKLSEDFLDEDWDPEKHERLMAEQFGDDYYAEEDADFNIADMDDAEAYERYLGDDGLGDIDYEDEGEEGDYGEEEEEEVAQPQSKEELKQARADLRKTAAAMEDELYQLDYEDIVAGLPCRFKYKQVEKESFGLTAEDILFADDTELNKYVSLKKISPYVHHSGYNDAELSKKRKRLRESVKERLAREAEEAEKAGQQLKGTKPKVKQDAKLEEAQDAGEGEEDGDQDGGAEGVDGEGKKRKRKRRKGANAAAQLITKDSALAGQSTLAPARASTVAAPKESASQGHKEGSGAERGDKEKEKEKKKAKKSGKKKELSTQEKRMNLYR